MSRSGYSDYIEDTWAHIRWRGAVESAIRGERGQALLRELIEALDAMPDKRLYAGSFATADGEFCTLGVVGARRGTKMDDLGDEDDCDPREVAKRFSIAPALASEIMYLNDEWVADEWEFVDVEICGPMRPHYPEWGQHTRRARVHNPRAAEQRWHGMRRWAEENLKKGRVTA